MRFFLKIENEKFYEMKKVEIGSLVAPECRKIPSWPPLPANSATLVCGESAAAQGLGALFRNLNRRLWHCRAKSSFRLTAVSR